MEVICQEMLKSDMSFLVIPDTKYRFMSLRKGHDITLFTWSNYVWKKL
jgi:hypothetical protein